MAGEIKNLEIFGAGKHNASTGTVTITEDDLDQIVASFNALKDSNVVKPHLKLGHTEAQKWFGQSKGAPSLGWINRVWREGKKLLADVTDVPDALLELIKSKRYHNVSAEVYTNAGVEVGGKIYNQILSAVALLGVEMPAVKDLAGLASVLASAEPDNVEGQTPLQLSLLKEAKLPGEIATFSQAQVDSLINAEVEKAKATVKAEFTEQMTAKDAEIKVLKDRAEAAEAEIKKVKAEAVTAQATTLVDTAIKEGKILPKQKDFALALLTSSDAKVKFGEGEKSMAELFQEFIKTSGKTIDTSETGAGGGERKEFSTAAEEVDHLTRLEMGKDTTGKLNYSDALSRVLAANDDLKDRYVNGAA